MTNNNNQNRPFENKWICITGASRGLGRCFALEFARNGGNLILAARNIELLTQVQNECLSCNVQCLQVIGDLTEDAARLKLEKICLERKIDILVNNAGIVWVKPLQETAPDDIDKLIATNLNIPIKLRNPSKAMNPNGWPVESRPTVTPISANGTQSQIISG